MDLPPEYLVDPGVDPGGVRRRSTYGMVEGCNESNRSSISDDYNSISSASVGTGVVTNEHTIPDSHNYYLNCQYVFPSVNAQSPFSHSLSVPENLSVPAQSNYALPPYPLETPRTSFGYANYSAIPPNSLTNNVSPYFYPRSSQYAMFYDENDPNLNLYAKMDYPNSFPLHAPLPIEPQTMPMYSTIYSSQGHRHAMPTLLNVPPESFVGESTLDPFDNSSGMECRDTTKTYDPGITGDDHGTSYSILRPQLCMEPAQLSSLEVSHNPSSQLASMYGPPWPPDPQRSQVWVSPSQEHRHDVQILPMPAHGPSLEGNMFDSQEASGIGTLVLSPNSGNSITFIDSSQEIMSKEGSGPSPLSDMTQATGNSRGRVLRRPSSTLMARNKKGVGPKDQYRHFHMVKQSKLTRGEVPKPLLMYWENHGPGPQLPQEAYRHLINNEGTNCRVCGWKTAKKPSGRIAEHCATHLDYRPYVCATCNQYYVRMEDHSSKEHAFIDARTKAVRQAKKPRSK
ncbi:hypothetical protein FRC19_005907 [Serendipita sp. 401]|nr:hypothetical protein FRC19_005907 [Serendipita sp. 401]